MKTQQIIAAIVIIVVLALGTHRAMQPNLGLLKFRAEGNVAYGHGSTDDRSVPMMRKFFKEHPEVDTLIFGKMSGTRDADMNLRIAYEIRRRGLKTVLTDRSYIASGAVDLFLAGVERTATCKSMIGVHSWSYPSGRGAEMISPKDLGRDRRQKLHEKFLTDMGIDPAFYVFTREASEPEDVYILTPEDINRFGVTTEPLVCG